MTMKQIKRESNPEAAKASFKAAKQANLISKGCKGKNKHLARKIKVAKILNAVKADPLAFEISIDDHYQLGMEYVRHEELGALHLLREDACVVRRYQADARSQVFYEVVV
jgi:hypothetical protein